MTGCLAGPVSLFVCSLAVIAAIVVGYLVLVFLMVLLVVLDGLFPGP